SCWRQPLSKNPCARNGNGCERSRVCGTAREYDRGLAWTLGWPVWQPAATSYGWRRVNLRCYTAECVRNRSARGERGQWKHRTSSLALAAPCVNRAQRVPAKLISLEFTFGRGQ